jgi:hypothetical protein
MPTRLANFAHSATHPFAKAATRAATVVVAAAALLTGSHAMAQDRPVILITGYWPPTNNMVRQFSPSHAAPGGVPGSGWVGSDWEGRGYDIVSYFPEFPGQTGPNWGRGSGWLEVDYQDTAQDFEELTALHKPAAIITFSRANTSVGWEMEPATQRFRLPGEANPPGRNIPVYRADYSPTTSNERYPTNVPIATEPVGRIRNSTLPMQQIVTNISQQMTSAQASPFIAAYNPATPDTFDFGGEFLSGYIGYLGSWYQAQNAPGESRTPCFAAGHIHVGTNMTAPNAQLATEITLRTMTTYLDSLGVIPSPGPVALSAAALATLLPRRRRN